VIGCVDAVIISATVEMSQCADVDIKVLEAKG
jgi:hypothetical protein